MRSDRQYRLGDYEILGACVLTRSGSVTHSDRLRSGYRKQSQSLDELIEFRSIMKRCPERDELVSDERRVHAKFGYVN